MLTYVANAACRGHRPATLSARRDYSRPHLTAALIKERGVARFVVAPPSYGKSSVAAEYAEVVFAFKNVFWLVASSPCFARDLDAGTLLDQIYAADPSTKLVVVDDLPLLDPKRAEAFSTFIDEMIERDVEVVVACTPSADVYGVLQHDRIKLNASDLLLTDQEIAETLARVDCPDWLRSCTSPAVRVAGVAWAAGDEGTAVFVSHLGDEELPGLAALVQFALILLGEGDVSVLSRLCSSYEQSIGDYNEDYPHLGLSEETGRYETVPAEVADVNRAFRSKMRAMVAASSLSDCTELVFAIAGLLMAAGHGWRALDVVDKMCPRAERAGWVDRNARDIARQGLFAKALEVIDRLPKDAVRSMRHLEVVAAFFNATIDERKGAFNRAKRAAFDASAPNELRLASLTLVARCGGEIMQARAAEELSKLRDGGCIPSRPLSFWQVVSCGSQARAQGDEAFLDFCTSMLESCMAEDVKEYVRPDGDAACLVVSWLFDLYGRRQDGRDASSDVHFLEAYGRAESFVRSRMDAPSSYGIDYFTGTAALALERAHVRGLFLAQGTFDVATLMALRSFEMAMIQQKALNGKRNEEKSLAAASRIQTHPDAFLYADAAMPLSSVSQRVPQVSIKLFGRLDIWVGDRHLTAESFRRKSTRQLLVMLAINNGREVSRKSISELLWPESDPSRASRNFYTSWSELRRLLSLPDGTCPYLSRHEIGCSLEPRYVHTDVGRLAEICRDLVFGEVNVSVWSEMFREIDRDFGDELAPFESSNPLILGAREEYRARLIDALVTAARRVTLAGEPQYGVWFARRALMFDELREDAYLALMAAQAASGQRTAAMGTFFRLRRVLSERLGIDPSPEAVALYESLLDCGKVA